MYQRCLRWGVYMTELFLMRGIPRTTCSRVREPRTTVPHGPVPGFMVMGLTFWIASGQISCLCLNMVLLRVLLPYSFLLTHTHLSAKMDSSKRDSERLSEDIMRRNLFSPLGPSQILWKLFSAATLHFLLGTPVVKLLMQTVITVFGQGGQFWSPVP